MPKIKDLGINIVPGTMRPPEIGGGGGGCRHRSNWYCPDDTNIKSDCDCISNQCKPHSRMWGAQQMNPSDCNCISDVCRPNSLAGRAGAAMTDTMEWDCFPTALCSNCDCISNMDRPCDPYSQIAPQPPSACTGCLSNVAAQQACLAASRGTLITPHTPNLAAGVLSRDDIANLRGQLKRALENLDVAEKNLLPKTVEEVDAREKELQRELEALKARRNELKK